jgi:hypothetical protein
MAVEFGNSKAFKIDSDELREQVIVECERLLGKTLKRDYFPGPQPVAVEMKDLETLKNGYMVCEKSDGERAILLMIIINNKPMCFMINRNNELYFMEFSFKKEVFEGSIMDGEIIKTKSGTWNYLIHDCMCYNGKSFMEKSHDLRYGCIIDFILKRYQNKDSDCLAIKTKLFYRYGAKIDVTWQHIKKTTENEIDGLIFTPINGPIIFGRDNSLFKWKESENNTIDLLVKQTPKKITLSYIRKSSNVIFKTFEKDDPNWSIINDYNANGVIVEFKFINELFVPYRKRTDKNKPNGEITVLNTLKNIEEAIEIKHLVASFETLPEISNIKL